MMDRHIQSPTRVVFRVDASIEIGSGHVMRCLALAGALQREGTECHFICRPQKGDLTNTIEQQGFHVHRLPIIKEAPKGINDQALKSNEPQHSHWLGTDWQTDFSETQAYLDALSPQWLVVDHYALDHRWERSARPHTQRILVIDDLVDRQHDADLLIDQTLGRTPDDYQSLVPQHCQCLTGAMFALLRPEFAQWRPFSLQRRQHIDKPQKLLVTMGGVDQHNVTGKVLAALSKCSLPDDLTISIIMGSTAIWQDQVHETAQKMACHTEVVTGVQNMAERMSYADLAIGAAGSTTWERCCLGLPSLMVILAENQSSIAAKLAQAGASITLAQDNLQDHLSHLWTTISHTGTLKKMGHVAQEITDGRGIQRLVEALKQC